MSFVNNAIKASQIYFEYLKINQGSMIKYDVKTVLVKGNYCFLRLKSKLRSLDMLQIKINTTIYSDERIKILEYKEETNALKISADKSTLAYLSTIKPNEIQVVVDLKFLVKNVERFYSDYGYLIKLPSKTNNVLYFSGEICGHEPSEEQSDAVNCALQYPLSYIWGAPGTGKTRFVLAQCILAYFQCFQNPKLLITAPTNNAVEQMLYGVLPVLKENHIELSRVLRLGTASHDFVFRYPECCEHKSLEKRAEIIRNQINKNNEEISILQQMLLRYITYDQYLQQEKQLEECKIFCEEISEKLYSVYYQYCHFSESIQSQNKQIQSLKGDIIADKGKKAILEEKISKLEPQIFASANKIESLTALIQKYSTGFRKTFGKLKTEKYSLQLSEAIKEYDNNKAGLEALRQQLNEINKNISINWEKIESLGNEIQNNKEQMRQLCSEFGNYKDDILSVTSFMSGGLYQISIKLTLENLKEILHALFDAISGESDKIQKSKSEVIDKSVLPKEEITDNINELKMQNDIIRAENAKVLSQSTSARIGDCSIIAATIDNCIAKIIPKGDFMPMHIFLDEAGYCPFVKAAVLFAYDAPVTLLGDHMQLPPICEMDPDRLTAEDKAVVLYSLSAVYIERIEDSVDDLFELYYNTKKDPDFHYTAFAELNHSFRFGERLAEILADDVYSSRFKGSDEHPTRLFYIDSAKTDDPKARTSKAEVESIKAVLTKRTDIDLYDPGILAPYKNQIKLLKKSLPNYEVLTVHQSQGREWNTVILSVVDTTNKWFTNSLLKKSNGKNVINTAVSRAKENLILVCDYNYWITQRKQLIGQILSVSEEIKIPLNQPERSSPQ